MNSFGKNKLLKFKKKPNRKTGNRTEKSMTRSEKFWNRGIAIHQQYAIKVQLNQIENNTLLHDT